MMYTRRTNVTIDKPKLGNRERRSPRRSTKTPSSNEIKNKYKNSPKGKRKLDFPFKGKKGPLFGKLFYLDLHGSQWNQLKKTIGQLGGTVEEFFRKEVTYLVTANRGDCGKSPSSQSAPSPGTPSPMSFTRSSSTKNYAVPSPMSTDSPQGLDTHQTRASSCTTRGKSIASRSAGFKKGTTDILSNATTWGVQIIHVDILLKWISQLILKANQQHSAGKQKTSSPTKRVGQTKVPKVVALQETFIKVEDLGFKYRPLIHEFKVWPELTFGCSNVCPFDPPRRRTSENSITKRKNGEETTSVKKPLVLERPKHGYCECCEVRYADLDMHLRGKQHRDFSKKDSNYRSLDKAINEGPKIEDLLKEIHLRKSNGFPHIAPVTEKTSLSISSGDADDVQNDDVFLLSTPRSSRRNQNRVLDHTPPSKENENDVEQHRDMSLNVSVDHDNVQETESLSKQCSPKKIANQSCLPKEMESRQSGPITRLQKASSNPSSPCESKHLRSSKGESVLKSSENKAHSKDIRKNKTKSTEVTEERNQLEVLECMNSLCDNVNTELNDVENEHNTLRRTTCRKTVLSLSITTERENQNEAEVQLSQDVNNKVIECENKLSNEKNYGEMRSKGVSDQSDKAALTESGEQSTTSERDLIKEKTLQQSTCSKKTDNKEMNNESKRPKRKCVARVDDCNQTSTLKTPIFDDRLLQNRKSVKGADDKTVVNGSKASDREGSEEIHHLQSSKRRCNKVFCDLSDTGKDPLHSNDSPRLQVPSKGVTNDNSFLAMCPGALIEEGRATTVRSSRRRKSAVSECKLSPIPPCNLDGEYSVRSSCSEDIEFLPSGLRIYSSFSCSSMDGVSKDVNYIVKRIEKQFDSDGDADNENLHEVDSESDTLSGCDEISKGHTADAPASSKLDSKDVVQDKTKEVENTKLQVSLTYLNVDAICASRGKDVDSSVNAKRKRNFNDEEKPTKARKYTRLSERDASDSEQDKLVKSLSSGYTSESEVKDKYRSSVAERVKIQRAILESLEESYSSTVFEPESSPERPQVQLTVRKRKSIMLLSSPFVEITNTCKKKRERAKSEGKIRTSARAIVKQNQHGRSQPPRSACLTPNDPFSFDDY